LILRIVILGAGMLVPGKKPAAYPFGFKMRNTVMAFYDAVLAS
jgi:hypothetical protein